MDIKLIAKPLVFALFADSCALFKGRVAFRPTREASFGPPRRPPAGFRWLCGRPHLHQNSQNPSPRRRQSEGFVAALPRQSQVQHAPVRQAQLRIGGQDQPRPPVGLLGVAHPWARPPERLLEKAEGVLQVEAPDVGAPEELQVRRHLLRPVPPQPQNARLAPPLAAGQSRNLHEHERPDHDRQGASASPPLLRRDLRMQSGPCALTRTFP